MSAMIADKSPEALGIAGSDDRESLLRELDHRVRNNLSVLLGLVRFHLDYPPSSATAALSRIAGQIMALSTIYDMTRGEEGGTIQNASELCAFFISSLERELCPSRRIEFTSIGGSSAIPTEAARTLGLALGEMLLDSAERSSRSDRAPEIMVSLAYKGECRFSIKVRDTAPREDSPLMASALAQAMDGKLETIGDENFTERELTFSSAGRDGSCMDTDA